MYIHTYLYICIMYMYIYMHIYIYIYIVPIVLFHILRTLTYRARALSPQMCSRIPISLSHPDFLFLPLSLLSLYAKFPHRVLHVECRHPRRVLDEVFSLCMLNFHSTSSTRHGSLDVESAVSYRNHFLTLIAPFHIQCALSYRVRI